MKRIATIAVFLMLFPLVAFAGPNAFPDDSDIVRNSDGPVTELSILVTVRDGAKVAVIAKARSDDGSGAYLTIDNFVAPPLVADKETGHNVECLASVTMNQYQPLKFTLHAYSGTLDDVRIMPIIQYQ